MSRVRQTGTVKIRNFDLSRLVSVVMSVNLTQIVHLVSRSSRCRGAKSLMYTRRTILNLGDSKSGDILLFLNLFVNGPFTHNATTYNIDRSHFPPLFIISSKKKKTYR